MPRVATLPLRSGGGKKYLLLLGLSGAAAQIAAVIQLET
jgi:hypothetical protein